jgi:hypothetical protein
MRPLVRSAMASSSAVARKGKKELEAESQRMGEDKSRRKGVPDAPELAPSTRNTAAEDSEDEEPRADHDRSRRSDKPKDFERTSSSAPRRLNDIAQAPPELRKLPRGVNKGAAKSASAKEGKAKSVLSMAQRTMMEAERAKAIKRYRELKEHRMTSQRQERTTDS